MSFRQKIPGSKLVIEPSIRKIWYASATLFAHGGYCVDPEEVFTEISKYQKPDKPLFQPLIHNIYEANIAPLGSVNVYTIKSDEISSTYRTAVELDSIVKKYFKEDYISSKKSNIQDFMNHNKDILFKYIQTVYICSIPVIHHS